MLSRIQDSKTLAEFFFDEIETNVSAKTPEGMAAAAKKAAPLFNLLPNGVLKEILINTLAEKTGVDSEKLQNRLGIESASSRLPRSKLFSARIKVINLTRYQNIKVRPLVEQAVEILIANPELGGNIGQSVLDDLSRDPEKSFLFDLLVWTRDAENVDQERVLIYCREKLNYQVRRTRFPER